MAKATRKPGAKKGAQPANTNAQTTGFYSDRFTPDELARIAEFALNPTLDDEIWMVRVLNHRLLAFTEGQDAGGVPIPIDTLIKLAEAMATGAGRVARLLRDKRALSGEATDGLAGALSNALDEIATEMGIEV